MVTVIITKTKKQIKKTALLKKLSPFKIELPEILVNKIPKINEIHPKINKYLNFFLLIPSPTLTPINKQPKTKIQKINFPIWLIHSVK